MQSSHCLLEMLIRPSNRSATGIFWLFVSLYLFSMGLQGIICICLHKRIDQQTPFTRDCKIIMIIVSFSLKWSHCGHNSIIYRPKICRQTDKQINTQTKSTIVMNLIIMMWIIFNIVIHVLNFILKQERIVWFVTLLLELIDTALKSVLSSVDSKNDGK